MTTTVVDVHVKYIRPKYNNLKEWIDDDQNVYIGRGGVVFVAKERYPKYNSIWANPYKSTLKKKPDVVEIRKEHERLVEKYEIYIRGRLDDENDTIITVDSLSKLKGKRLGCWCVGSGNQCHGDVLVKLINEYANDDDDV